MVHNQRTYRQKWQCIENIRIHEFVYLCRFIVSDLNGYVRNNALKFAVLFVVFFLLVLLNYYVRCMCVPCTATDHMRVLQQL